jgi:hypothetical protein
MWGALVAITIEASLEIGVLAPTSIPVIATYKSKAR